MALEIFDEVLPAAHSRVLDSERLLGRCLTALGRYEQAEAILLRNHGRAEHSAKTIEALVDLYGVWGKPNEAAKWRAKARTSSPASGEH